MTGCSRPPSDAEADTFADTGSLPLPLVLLPGTWCDERLFEQLIAELGDRPTQVALYGEAATVEDAVDLILAQAPRRFALLGFSLGAIVALDIALRHPERLAGLALVAGTARAVPPAQHRARWRETKEAARQVTEFVARRLWPTYVADPASASPVSRELILAMAERGGSAAFARQTGIALSRADRRPALGKITLPVMVVGGAEDRINPPTVQRELAEAITGAQLTILPGVGHLIPLEAPRQLARLTTRSLECIDQAERTKMKVGAPPL